MVKYTRRDSHSQCTGQGQDMLGRQDFGTKKKNLIHATSLSKGQLYKDFFFFPFLVRRNVSHRFCTGSGCCLLRVEKTRQEVRSGTRQKRLDKHIVSHEFFPECVH